MRKITLLILIVLLFLIASPWASAVEIVPCGHGASAADACTICHLIIGIKNLISFGQAILITVAAVGIFIGGFMYIISAGDQGAITSAKNFLAASLKGFAIFLLSWFIVNLVMWVLSFNPSLSIGQVNWYTFTCSTKSSATDTMTEANTKKDITEETIVEKVNCECAIDSWGWWKVDVGPDVKLSSVEECKQVCISRHADYYQVDGKGWVSVKSIK